MLDLINSIEVRSVPSPNHPSARGDIGSVTATVASNVVNDARASLADFLCLFQLLYSDGVERLGAKSARERVRWVGAICYVWLGLEFVSKLTERSF